MAIYAIGDLHLAFNKNKPMDIFGDNWKNHEKKIADNWKKEIKNDDLVVLPGDFSWAMHLRNTLDDFYYLDKLPGKKVLTKGNHDYWWTTLKSMNDFLNEYGIRNVSFIINNAIEFENYVVVGTRGWSFGESDNSEKMQKRELVRLENSIKYAKDNFDNSKKIICALHYPPITKQMICKNKKSEYIELMKKYSIDKCIYGHLHGNSHREAVEGDIEGVMIKLVSCDYLNFKPIMVAE